MKGGVVVGGVYRNSGTIMCAKLTIKVEGDPPTLEKILCSFG